MIGSGFTGMLFSDIQKFPDLWGSFAEKSLKCLLFHSFLD